MAACLKKEAILFLHIPKAGGSTLRALLHQQYDEAEVYKIESDINGDILRFATLDAARLKQIKLVTGHMSFGLHTFLDGARYLTLLRDPIKRVISEYRFIFSNQHHSLHPQVKQMSLMAYLDSGLSSQISNGQTRLIAGIYDNDQCGVPGTKAVLEEDYRQALQNLERHFLFPGVLDYYDETLLDWQKALGWNWPFYLRANITPVQFDASTEEDIMAIEAINGWDIQLYQHVKQQQERRLKQHTGLYKQRVKLFKRLNGAYASNRVSRRLFRQLGRLR